MSVGGTLKHRGKHSVSKQRLRLWLRLLRTTRHMENALRERLRINYGATLPRFDVMAALFRVREGLTMGELSRMLMISNGNVTGIVDRLVADGLVTRSAVKGDRRAFRIALTDRGLTLFTAMATDHESWVNELLGDIPADIAGDIIQHLSAIRREP